MFKYLLPFFLFQWNSRIKMTPDLDDIREYCKEKKHLSYLYNSYKEIIAKISGIDISAQEEGKIIKKGTRAELINYLVQEVGTEIEFVWKTKYFYVSGQVKTEDLGNVLKLLSKGDVI